MKTTLNEDSRYWSCVHSFNMGDCSRYMLLWSLGCPQARWAVAPTARKSSTSDNNGWQVTDTSLAQRHHVVQEFVRREIEKVCENVYMTSVTDALGGMFLLLRQLDKRVGIPNPI